MKTNDPQSDQSEELIIPDLYLYCRDVTKDCDETWRKEHGVGKVTEVYQFDANRSVNCCEMTPSFEMEFLYHRIEPAEGYADLTEDRNEEIGDEEIELDANNEGAIYVHVFKIEGRADVSRHPAALDAEEWKLLVDEHDGDTDAAHEAMMEGAAEHQRCNPSF